MPARRLLVSGRAQGVFFRNWTVDQARALGLTGWVRNLRSGEVEILAVGPEQALDALAASCLAGPPAARVHDIKVEQADEEPLSGFDKRPSV